MKKMKRAAIFAALVLVVVLSTGCGSENTCSTSKELNYAISNGNYAAVQEIMKTNKGMNLEQLEDKKDGNDSYEERRAVGILLEHGCGRVCDILKILVSSGAKLDSLSSEGQSYLNMTSDYDCLTVLLENGANPNMQCKNGYSAFDNFIKELPADKLGVSKTVKYIDLFIQHGAVFSKNSMEMAKKMTIMSI